MIKSVEEFNEIANLFGSDGKINSDNLTEFLRYIKKNDRLTKLIKDWNSEQEKLTETLDILEARGFSLKLRSVRRLYLNEFKDDIIPDIETEIIEKKRTELINNSLKIKRGDTFRCIKDVTSEDGSTRYKKGKVYISDIDGCITNEKEDTWESWFTYRPEFSLHFEVCENPGIKPNELIEIKEGDRFKCIKDYNEGEIEFFKDNIYESGSKNNNDDCYIDFLDRILLSKFQEHFIKI